LKALDFGLRTVSVSSGLMTPLTRRQSVVLIPVLGE
jgi:hypothetical protein